MTNTPSNRRRLLRAAAGLALGAGTVDVSAAAAPASPPGASPDWTAFARHYDIAPDVANLENGYYGIMARPVLDAFKRNIDTLNRNNSAFLRREFDGAGIETIRATLAAHAGVATNEIAITRGATESLQNLIANYKPLRAGDTAMMGNLDYPAMQYAMTDLAQRRGAALFTVQIPEPATRRNVTDAYEAALRRNPRTRLLLLTHISHRTGLVTPVREIVEIAKRRHVDVIVDIAQSWGQLDFKIPDLGADFVGANLHKWIGAPLGTGFLYIRAARLGDIGVQLGDRENPENDIRSRVHSGTLNAAAVMTIPDALAFHGQIGLAERGARLRALRNSWVSRVRDLPGVQVLTPDEPGMVGAVTSFRLRGRTSYDANVDLARRLFDDYRIFTVARDGPVGGSCVRVTPALFTPPSDLDRLVVAIQTLAKQSST